MGQDWSLWVVVDGSYTNRTVINHLPEATVLIGRIRSDARLYHYLKLLVPYHLAEKDIMVLRRLLRRKSANMMRYHRKLLTLKHLVRCMNSKSRR
jgi:hypothetical protein